jgi:urea-proton symporter
MQALILYIIGTLLIVVVSEYRRAPTSMSFLLANKQLKGIKASLSITATWIWAPALFVSTQIGYQWGLDGLVWFTLPNVIVLVAFGIIAQKVVSRNSSGTSFFIIIEELPGKDPSRLYLRIVFIGLQLVCLGMQVTAGAELLSISSDIPYSYLVLVMTLLPLVYSLRSGLISSVLTDWIQCLLILFAASLFVICFPSPISFQDSRGFNPFEVTLMKEFGIASFLTLIFGSFADQQGWQRAFAISGNSIRRTFIIGGIIHGVITFLLGLLGFLIYNEGFQSVNPQLVGAEFILEKMSSIFFALFMIMALSGLCSTVDSVYCAISSLFVTEIRKSENNLNMARKVMIITALIGIAIGFLRVPIITLWLMAGILRLSSVSAILGKIFIPSCPSRVLSQSILAGVIIGLPLFLIGAYQQDSVITLLAMVMCVVSSCATFVYSLKRDQNGLLAMVRASS